jgi:radical SAM protein with 4Fe4S-binding SPASM domain
MRPELITNGLLVAKQAEAIAEAGFFAVTMSVDGTAAVHDRLRRVPGALKALLEGAAALSRRGVLIGASTQVNKANLGELDAIHDLLAAHGFRGWQVQLTLPHGRASKNRDALFIEPEDLLTLESNLLTIQSRSDLFIQIADTIGYMGRGEPRLRSGDSRAPGLWGTCAAGTQAVGITSDGTVRGCLSMPADFDEGNIRLRPLKEIWQDQDAFSYNRKLNLEDLTGPCADCALKRFCRGGCTNLAFVATGNLFSQPYCLRRLY